MQQCTIYPVYSISTVYDVYNIFVIYNVTVYK